MFSPSDQVKDVLEEEGISLQELNVILAKAAITSLRGANRRYHQWLFYVNPGSKTVERMFKHTVQDQQVKGWVEHRFCNGWGCHECGWSGQVSER